MLIFTPDYILVVIVVLSAFACTWAGTALLRRWALRLSLLDIPNERSSHTVPMPRGGGLAIVIAVLIGLPALALYREAFSARIIFTYLGGGAILVVAGWMDDRGSWLPVRYRLAMQFATASFAVIGVGFFSDVRLPFMQNTHLGWLGLPLTLLWIVGLINVYNFMDGIDGLAAGQAVIGGMLWAVVGWQSGAELIVCLGILIASASFGFLLHNWPPARIFMGDVASGFLGFSFAALPLMAKVDEASQGSLLGTGVLVLWPFLFDTIFTFLKRLCRHEDVFRAHRSHLYQRLVIAGLPHVAVTGLYLVLSAFGGLVGMAWARAWPGAELGILLVPCAAWGLWVGVRWIERRVESAASLAILYERE